MNVIEFPKFTDWVVDGLMLTKASALSTVNVRVFDTVTAVVAESVMKMFAVYVPVCVIVFGWKIRTLLVAESPVYKLLATKEPIAL